MIADPNKEWAETRFRVAPRVHSGLRKPRDHP
jgi:hypothetical protein